MAESLENLAQRLDSMTTRWSLVRRAHQQSILSSQQARNELVLRYSASIRSYVRALVRNDGRADELAQDAVVRLLSGDFAGADPDRGRFRDLLKVAVRNMVKNHWAKENRRRTVDYDIGTVEGGTPDDPEWIAGWRKNALDLTWAALEDAERSQNAGSVAILRLRAAWPDATSEEIAARLSEQTGAPVSPEAARQKLRRARVKFAELLVDEIAHGLESPSTDDVEEELTALGLFEYVRDLLPSDWKGRGSRPPG